MDLEGAPQRRRGQELEDALLDAAWAQLIERGYGDFTIEAVAERAQTSRPVIYRRWPDRAALALAALVHGLGSESIETPDTGNLRDDVIALLTKANESRAAIIPLVSVLIGAYYAETGSTFADIRAAIIGERVDAMEQILKRAGARGEIDLARVTPRVAAVAVDLFRHDALMTLRPLTPEGIRAIVDEVFLPLVTR
ncbi:TetR/AcrR family transcriptional regulator [Rathayibacter sp. YIM 133350]|uniref:TetR/AcrR family transcriptional regulator n=1 Tax=Rathayibacter sp. YIM 133350 TaxID=3131992 RepID=UPI00307D392D